MARVEPVIAACLAGAPSIQLFDIQLLREQIIASIADGSGAEEFEPGRFARLTTGARHGDQQPPLRAG